MFLHISTLNYMCITDKKSSVNRMNRTWKHENLPFYQTKMYKMYIFERLFVLPITP